MAERVQKRLENAVSHLEWMEKVGLFTIKEIRLIIKRRRDHEYRICRTIKCKEDYLRYIQYEISVLKLVRHRRNTFGIFKKKKNIDYAIIRGIVNLYKQALIRFKDDLQLYVEFMKFGKHVGYNDIVSQTLTEMLQMHSDKPKCHHIAGKWELEERKNINNARKYFINGIDHHPDSQLLYTDIFTLELDQADETAKKAEESATETSNTNETPKPQEEMPIGVKRAQIVYRMAFKKIKDVNFIIEMLNIAKMHKNTEKLQHEIIADLTRDYSNNPQMWHFMASQALEGLSYNFQQEESMEVDNSEETISLRDKITNCNEVYQTAVEKLKSETMWSLYIDCLLEINQDLSQLPNFKRKLLKNALIQGHQARKLEEKYYLYWIEMLTPENMDEAAWEKLSQVLCYGIDALPTSVNIWKAKLRHLMGLAKDSEINEEFEKASKLLGTKALPIWQMKLLYFQEKCPDKVKTVFEEVMKADLEIWKDMMPSYVEWLVHTKGIEAARQKYIELVYQWPAPLELHQKMAELEVIQPKICVKNARRPHELATMKFGQQNIQVWIDFMLFEMEHGNVLEASNIHWRAEHTLEKRFVYDFTTKWTLIKINRNCIVKNT